MSLGEMWYLFSMYSTKAVIVIDLGAWWNYYFIVRILFFILAPEV